MMQAVFYGCCAVTGVTTLITLANFLSAPRFKIKKTGDGTKKISVCVPARNEERNIANILHDILCQTYLNFEILVLNDNSEDSTGSIISSIGKENNKVSLIPGEMLPPGWTGKNWACHQLSQKAGGDILLFIDADVRLSPGALGSAAAYMSRYGLSMLSVFPTQRMETFSERLIVPVMDWILLTFLPLRLVYLSSWLSFVAANGQFIAITREAYDAIGGHKAVSRMTVEDMEIARHIKRNRLRMMTFLGNYSVNCRMYENFSGAFEGFTKNFFPGFNTGRITFIFMLALFNLLFTLPFILVFLYKEFTVIVLLILLQRLFISASGKQNFILNSLLHPLQMIIMTWIGINSVYKSSRGKLKWKGRRL